MLAWLSACLLGVSDTRAAGCAGGALPVAAGVTVAAMLEAADHPALSLSATHCSAEGVDLAWASTDRAVIASGKLQKTPQGLRLEVTARADGTFVIGLRVRAGSVYALDGGTTRYAAGAASETERFYPYNWKAGSHEAVAEQTGATGRLAADTSRIDLAMPGVRAGELYFVQSSGELSLLKLRTDSEGAEAILMLTRPAPSIYGDGAEIHWPLRPGDKRELSVLVSPRLDTIDHEKWGAPAPMTERMADVPFKSWAAEDYNLPPDTYRMIARNLAGAYDAVILRTMAPDKWVADIFKQAGLRVYLYQYWAAVRILDNRGTLPRGVKPEWVLHETGDNPTTPPYTAPHPNGAWQLLDVRQPEVRTYFVEIARKAVADGWDGVFYDGGYFWADSANRVGGRSTGCRPGPEPCMSLAYGRAKVMLEVKQAVHDVNPSARVGLLSGLRYVDQYDIADYASREAVNVGWANPDIMEAEYGPSMSARWLKDERPYFQTNLVWGSKGANPLLDRSSIAWANPAPRNFGLDIGDFDADRASEFAKTLGDAGRYFSDNRIVTVAPADSLIYGAGPSLIRVEQPTRITLEHPAPAFNLKAGELLGFTDAYRLEPQQQYVIAERSTPGGVHYSGERFAWFAPDLYLAGDIRFSQPPERDKATITVHGSATADGAVRLWSPVPPRDVLANGEPLAFAQDGPGWRFVVPTSPSTLIIEF